MTDPSPPAPAPDGPLDDPPAPAAPADAAATEAQREALETVRSISRLEESN